MDILFQGIVDILKPLGLNGLIIAALAFWIFRRETLITSIQNERIAEGKENVRAILTVNETLNKLADVIRSSASKVV